jgi:hypothetical protein
MPGRVERILHTGAELLPLYFRERQARPREVVEAPTVARHYPAQANIIDDLLRFFAECNLLVLLSHRGIMLKCKRSEMMLVFYLASIQSLHSKGRCMRQESRRIVVHVPNIQPTDKVSVQHKGKL